jgi:ribosomal protein S18
MDLSNDFNLDLETNPIKDDIATIKKQKAIAQAIKRARQLALISPTKKEVN